MTQHTLKQSGDGHYSTIPAGNARQPLPSFDHAPDTGGTGGNKNGIIIVQSDQIFITPPLPGGKPAVISAVHPVILKLNRKALSEPAEVTSTDHISWEISEKPQYQITVSDDRLNAYFTLYRVEKYAWKLVDCPAGDRVTLRAEPDLGRLLSRLTVDQIIAGFEQGSIIRSLNIPALYSELSSPTYLPVCIAAGKAPVPGKNACMEILHPAVYGTGFNPGGSFGDRLMVKEIPVVSEGEIFARKLPPQDGIPGFDVYGGIMPAPVPRDMLLTLKEGMVMLPDGGIMALRSGRPRITGKDPLHTTIDFPDSYMVSVKSEPAAAAITFPGDIIVGCDLDEGAVIEALGNVYLYGNASNATISATGSIVACGNISGCKLYSGYYGAKHNRLCIITKRLMEETARLSTAAVQLAANVESRQQSVKYGLVIMLLLESKYEHLPGELRELYNLLNSLGPGYPRDYGQLLRMLEVFLHPGQFTDYITDAVLAAFMKLLDEAYESVAVMQEMHTRIHITAAEGSVIQTGGEIRAEQICSSELISGGYMTRIDETLKDMICTSHGLQK
ncbi:flagellar assembly protein A [Paenibacillus sp. PK3_47]|uniref:flagellar assembly protein A n=1 Tax=Paenibacillus sp. PK3_47 TaxID=2072642 RepID=UPI00201E68A6|nr:flagellar assembly protein A [Paenibacillus sp. PK3_47]